MAKLVYKYVTPERIDVLQHGMIRFTQPGVLNDPFETMPDWTKFGDQLFDTITEVSARVFWPVGSWMRSPAAVDERRDRISRNLENVRHSFDDSVALLCLSRVKDNLLMWSHYAAEHRGFVIGFDAGHSFFNRPDATPMGELRDVQYSKDRWMMPSGGLISLHGAEQDAALVEFFFRKHSTWRYEREMRLLDGEHPTERDHSHHGLSPSKELRLAGWNRK